MPTQLAQIFVSNQNHRFVSQFHSANVISIVNPYLFLLNRLSIKKRLELLITPLCLRPALLNHRKHFQSIPPRQFALQLCAMSLRELELNDCLQEHKSRNARGNAPGIILDAIQPAKEGFAVKNNAPEPSSQRIRKPRLKA